jgi:hypothetical protein
VDLTALFQCTLRDSTPIQTGQQVSLPPDLFGEPSRVLKLGFLHAIRSFPRNGYGDKCALVRPVTIKKIMATAGIDGAAHAASQACRHFGCPGSGSQSYRIVNCLLN